MQHLLKLIPQCFLTLKHNLLDKDQGHQATFVHVIIEMLDEGAFCDVDFTHRYSRQGDNFCSNSNPVFYQNYGLSSRMLPSRAETLLVSVLRAGRFNGRMGVRLVTWQGKGGLQKNNSDYSNLKCRPWCLKKIEIIHKKSLTAG